VVIEDGKRLVAIRYQALLFRAHSQESGQASFEKITGTGIEVAPPSLPDRQLKNNKRKLMLDVFIFNLTWVKTNLSLSDNFQII
jgi:hypothetical protein